MYILSQFCPYCVYEKLITQLHSLRPAGVVSGNRLHGLSCLPQKGLPAARRYLRLDVPHLRPGRPACADLPSAQKPLCTVSRAYLYRAHLHRGISHRHVAEPPRDLSLELRTLPLEFVPGNPPRLRSLLVYHRAAF